MKIAIPDLVSNSYFPALAAVELGCFKEQGVQAEIALIFPPNRAYEALRDGEVDIVAASAHAAVSAFDQWHDARLLCAQSRGMYWFLVVRSDLNIKRGDLGALKGLRIGAAPWVELGLRGVLAQVGVEVGSEGVSIGPVPKQPDAGTNFGLSAFRALEKGLIDGFWANGMAAELAVRNGVGTVVLDVRRGDGPDGCAAYTFAAMTTSAQRLAQQPELAAITVRAVGRAHALLKENPGLAHEIGARLFPAAEASLIQTLVERDLPWYDTVITPSDFAAMNDFLGRLGLLTSAAAFSSIVCPEAAPAKE